jgi:hypothetical protein
LEIIARVEMFVLTGKDAAGDTFCPLTAFFIFYIPF